MTIKEANHLYTVSYLAFQGNLSLTINQSSLWRPKVDIFNKITAMDWTQAFAIIGALSAIIGGYVFLINKRFEDVNRRFEDMNRRIDRIEQDIRDIRIELKEMRKEITEIKVEMKKEITEIKILLYRVLEIPHKEDKG